VRCGRAKEAPHSDNVALEGEIIRPSIRWPGMLSEDAFGLFDTDGVQ
jgi:hypothetical protein